MLKKLSLVVLTTGLLSAIALFNNRPMQRVSAQSSDGDEMKQGLQFRLSNGASESSEKGPAVAPSTPLSSTETADLLSRISPLKQEASDQKEFALRPGSLPAPRTGKVIQAAFPPAESGGSPEAPSSGPLEVLRYAPEGDVPLVPHLSVTFSQPMVAVTSQEEAAANVPVKLSPQPAGSWRWIGTRTLIFQPDERFPMATRYTAEVPARIKSATGSPLNAPKNWTFSTPPPQVKGSYPTYGPQSRDPLMFVSFDQKIDPQAVLATIHINIGGRSYRVRQATADEVVADKDVKRFAAQSEPGRWVAFRAVPNGTSEKGLVLPAGANVAVVVGPGTPSMEGPLKTDKPQQFGFQTYGPLKVIDHRCGYNGCGPFDQWEIEFSNPLDEDNFDASQIKVQPAVEELTPAISGSYLSLRGLTKGRTTYTVTLSTDIKDQFGQHLSEPVKLTFNVGSAPPALAAPKSGFVVLDPYGPPRYTVYCVNQPALKVSLYNVAPEDWPAFGNYMRDDRRGRLERRTVNPPGKLIESKRIPVEAQPDELVEVPIDLSPALDRGRGQVIAIVEPTAAPRDQSYRDFVISSWIQVTNIGLDAAVDRTTLLAWASSLKDGAALNGVKLSLFPEKTEVTSGSDGVGRFQLNDSANSLLIARAGDDVAILPQSTYWWNDAGWRKQPVQDWLQWYVFDDRGMYRPGEEVHIKGWIRKVGGGTTGDVGALNDVASGVSYVLRDSRSNQVLTGNLQLNALGGFDTSFKLPDNMNLGYANLSLEAVGASNELAGRQQNHSFQVQEFRRPEYAVSASASQGPFFVGDHAEVTVKAAYYAGGGLPNAPVNWTVTATQGSYNPPGHPDFTFGEWVPWWSYRSVYRQPHIETFQGTTDFAGKHLLRIDFDSVNPATPYNLHAQATVTDVNRQAWAASADLLVHPADLYVGLRSPRIFVQKGEPLIVESIVTDLDGKLISGRSVTLRAVRLDWKYQKGEWKEVEADPQEQTITSGTDPVKATFQTREGGTYKIIAIVMDERERHNQSGLTLWVSGGKVPLRRDVEQETATLIPDRKEYKDGDTAEILVQSPFYPADGLVTLRRSGIVTSEHFHIDSPSYTLKVPIKGEYTPNINIDVELNGSADRAPDPEAKTSAGKPIPKRPAFASGSLNLEVPPSDRKLNVVATPAEKALEPGADTNVTVEVKDAGGNPVANSEVAVVVVDEAILSLTNFKLGDPISAFYQSRPTDTSDSHLRTDVMLASTADLLSSIQSGQGGGGGGRVFAKESARPAPMVARAMMQPSPSGVSGGMGGGNGAQPIRTRENFNALATFVPAAKTDSSGRITVPVKVPDNLTRYRVMAVAVAGGKQFGLGESAITARLPLMLRPSPPRFLNYGDKFELPVVVQNQTDSPLTVQVAVRATNVLLSETGKTVTVPANDRVEVRFEAAADKPGKARFQVAAASGKWSDASEFELPVWTPATTEAFATYGEIDGGGIDQPVKAPADAVTQFGGLEITTSSTQLQALTDAVLYLTAYPFECSEQLSSRIIAIAALKDVLTAFHAEGLPKPEEMTARVSSDIKRLESMQNSDGGFGFWERDEKSWPYLSIHVAHALQRAQAKGFGVPPDMQTRVQRYLANIESHIPSYYGPELRRALVAYSLYVRNLMGDRDATKARALISEAGLGSLSIESQGWLLSVLSGDKASAAETSAILKNLNNRAEETAGAASFTDSYADGEHLLLHSNRRTDAVILDALITTQPGSDLIPKVVRGLLAHRVAGHWNNTQENSFVLLALDHYFQVYEKATPDFVARAWLGEGYAGEHSFKGRSTDSYQVNIPMDYLKKAPGAQDLILSKDGTGRLYYRIGMRYAPENLNLKPADYGFAVERNYEAVDNPSDVSRDSNGVWHIKAGARVRVRIRMVAPARRYHVALVDPMPAGFEAMNPELAVTGSVPSDPKEQQSMGRWWWWFRPWFEHQNMRDERVEAFTSLLWEGVYDYSYVARATTPGEFVVPPSKAEEMYSPETFGRAGTDRVVIK